MEKLYNGLYYSSVNVNTCAATVCAPSKIQIFMIISAMTAMDNLFE